MTRTPLLFGGVVLVLLTLADFPRPLRLPPALKWHRSVGINGACPGDETVRVLAATSVTYCYTVTNTGRASARNIVIVDAGRSVRVGTLAGGQSRVIARTVVVTPDAGSLATVPGESTAMAPPVAGAAEAVSADAVTPLSGATAEAADDDSRRVESPDARVIEGGAPAIAPGLVGLGSTTAAALAAGPTLQSP
jgi:hypothetical protein